MYGYGRSKYGVKRGTSHFKNHSPRRSSSVSSLIDSFEQSFSFSNDSSNQFEVFLKPTKTDYKEVPLTCSSVRSYIESIKNNIKAEYWQFVSNFNPTQKFAVTLTSNKSDNKIAISRIRQIKIDDKGKKSLEEKEFSEFNSHLIIYKGNLCLLKGNTEKLFIWEGASINKSLNYDDNDYGTTIFDIGYIGDMINEYEACINCDDNNEMLQCIANPSKRKPLAFRSDINSKLPSSHNMQNITVPMNEQQRNIITNLKSNIEGVQGPPGTGK